MMSGLKYGQTCIVSMFVYSQLNSSNRVNLHQIWFSGMPVATVADHSVRFIPRKSPISFFLIQDDRIVLN